MTFPTVKQVVLGIAADVIVEERADYRVDLRAGSLARIVHGILDRLGHLCALVFEQFLGAIRRRSEFEYVRRLDLRNFDRLGQCLGELREFWQRR